MLSFNGVAAGAVGEFNRGTDDQHNPGEWPGKLEKVPSLFEGMSVFGKKVKGDDRAPTAPRQNNRSGFGKVARPAGAIGGERYVMSMFEVRCQHREATQTAARGTPVCGGKTKPFESAAQYLSVEIRAGHVSHAAMTPPPHGQENCLVPEGIDAAALLTMHPVDVLPA